MNVYNEIHISNIETQMKMYAGKGIRTFDPCITNALFHWAIQANKYP